MNKFDTDVALGEFFSECEEILQRITSLLTKLESQELSADSIDSLYRDVHTLKGSSQLFGFKKIGLIAHAIEASLEPVRSRGASLERSFVDQVFKGLDIVDKIVKNPKLDLDNDPGLQQELLELVPRLVSLSSKRFGTEFELTHSSAPAELANKKNLVGLIEKVQEDKNIPDKVLLPNQETLESNPKIKEMKTVIVEDQHLDSSTIRVQVGLLDKLMNLVGEMVLARNQVLQFARSSENNDFLNLTQRLDLVTTELQDNVMRTRMQPIGSVFTKFQRVVRDLGRDLGKTIELVIEGAETELDKSLIEAIKDPLTHIVRNSCDHGIEMPEERKRKGKNPGGIVSLKAYHEGGHVIIEIRDNGRGLDPKRILEKALEKRIVTTEKAEAMSSTEIQQLIFAPGFSTADQVSSVSGRGVGMDVVKTNIERVGGMIDLFSKVDEGTRIKLIIPLTLAIVPAMIIKSRNDFFAIPQVKLQELIRVDLEEDDKKIDKLQNQFVYRLRGDLLPLLDLNNLLNPVGKSEVRSVFNIVVLKTEGYLYGLIVDEICDTADIVVKPLPHFLKKIAIFSGSTIMGDGGVSLILDIQGVAEQIGPHKITQDKDLKSQKDLNSKATSDSRTEYLFFRLDHSGLYSIPLILVQRLEEFSLSEIEISGNEKMVKYRGSLLPLTDLSDYLGYKKSEPTKDKHKISVIVVSKHNRFFGLVVEEILDVLSSETDVMPLLKETAGIFGTIVFNDKQIVTVLDALGIIDDSLGLPRAPKITKKLSHKRVLFAEDTIFFARQVRNVLESSGLDVDHVENGELALEKLKKSDPHFYQLIISDIEMPVMNGYDFAKNVKSDSVFKSIPMIALTTRFNEADQKKGYASGFDKYLEKLKSDELMASIHELLGVDK